MNKPKHTPGPWEVVDGATVLRSNNHNDYPRMILDLKEATHSPMKGEAEANANLIASAPDLLKSLKWAMEHTGKPFQRIKGQNDDYCDGYEAALAAIAKAEGGKS